VKGQGFGQSYTNKEEQGMKKQGKKIEVRFFETAEFHLAPSDGWPDSDECGADE